VKKVLLIFNHHMKLFKLLSGLLLLIVSMPIVSFCQPRSIYSIEDAISLYGKPIHWKDYRGKLLLIINTASAHPSASKEMTQLRMLADMYTDSGLVAVLFPSNSFQNEPLGIASLQQLFGADKKLIIASPCSVKDAAVHPLFSWLASKAKNGVVNVSTHEDYQKFLLDKLGHLVGYFSGATYATDSNLLRAIDKQLGQ
jgi:glutathione peroxidase